MFWLSLLACGGSAGPKDVALADSASGSPASPTPDPTPSDTPTPDPWACADAQAALTAGVGALDLGGGLPSTVLLFGPRSCPIVEDEADRLWVGAAYVGAGRVVHVGHEGWMTDPRALPGDTFRFAQNVLEWTSGGGRRIAVHPDLSGAVGWLTEAGYAAEVVAPQAAALSGFDAVWVTSYPDWTEAEQADLLAFVEGGGGLVSGGHAWWWATSHTDPAATHYPGNRLLQAFDLVVTEGTANGQSAVRPLDRLDHHHLALAAAQAHLEGSAPLSFADQVRASDTARLAIEQLPVSFTPWFDQVRPLLDAGEAPVPTPASPVVPAEQPIEALLVTSATVFALQLPPEEVFAIAADFPGPVTGTGRAAVTARLHPATAGWDPIHPYSGANEPVALATGAYVPPGEVVQVDLPAAWVDQGLQLQIGIHTDTLWHLDRWDRHPELTRRLPVDAPRVAVASGLGGPLYLLVPAGTDLPAGELRAEGGVPHPYYQHGLTDPAAFLAALAASQAPLFELGSNKFALTLALDDYHPDLDPAALLTLWDQVLDADADLAALPRERPRAERIAMDRQISAGWMHSGYPIMAYTYGRALSDAATLGREGDWGAFHELGHNHQLDPLNLPGTTECTVNLWSVYAMETVVGRSRDVAHDALDPAARAATLEAYLAGGADFADWSVWTCLETWLQLQEAFGWPWVIELHRRARALPPADRPSSDSARVDWFAEEASRVAGQDLTGFLLAWGLPVSAGVVDGLADLPDWVDHPLAGR